MRKSFLVAVVAIFSTAAAQFSPEQCGPFAGSQKCSNNKCCSQHGWCGTTDAYCATKCQIGFGTCKGVTVSRSSSAARASSTLSGPIGTSTDKCGPTNKNLVCAPSYCCSQYGYCGKTAAYCGKGCQSAFTGGNICLNSAISSPAGQSSSTLRSSTRMGNPSSLSSSARVSSSTRSSSPSASSSAAVSTNGRCGPRFGKTTCQGSRYGDCCSQYDYCGKSQDHCTTGCQFLFGKCTGTSSSSSFIQSSSARSSASSSRVASSSASASRSVASASSSAGSSSIRSSGSSLSASSSAARSSAVGVSSSSSLSIHIASSSATLITVSSSSYATSSFASSSARSGDSRDSASSSATSSSAVDVSSSSSYSSHVGSSSVTSTVAPSSSHATSSSASSSLPSSSLSHVDTSSNSQTYVSSTSVLMASSSKELVISSTIASSGSASTDISSDAIAASSSALACINFNPKLVKEACIPFSFSEPLPSSSVPATSATAASVSASATPVAGGFSSDPLSDPSAIDIEKPSNVQSQIVNDPASAPPGSSGSFLSLSTDGNGAAITVTTRPEVQSGTSYTISVWLRTLTMTSRCAVTVKVDGNTVGGPYDDITTQWKEYTTTYTAAGTTSPLLALVVDCSAGPNIPRFKRAAGDGLAMGDLSMDANTVSVVSSSVVASASGSQRETILPTSGSLSSAIIPATSSVAISDSTTISSAIIPAASSAATSDSASSSSDIVSATISSELIFVVSSVAISDSIAEGSATVSSDIISATSSAFASGSTVIPSAVISTTFSIAASDFVTTTSAPPLSTAIAPSGCTPTILDGGFENFVAVSNPQSSADAGTSNDWSVSGEWFEQDGGWFGGIGFGPSYSGGATNVYNAFTNSTLATTYDIKYKHPLNLCAGISYDVSGWTRTQYTTGSRWNSEGCRMTAFLDAQQAFTDRIGYWDYPRFRYVHGVVTPTADTVSAELFFRVECKVPQRVSARGRGIKLDEVAVVPVSQWSFPAAAVPPTNTITPEAFGPQSELHWPQQTACVVAQIDPARTGCMMHGNQVGNHDFETCSHRDWSFSDFESNFVRDPDTAGHFDFNLTGIFHDEVHSGENSMRIVLKEGGGAGRMLQSGRVMRVCAERTYKWSIWAKQATANACTGTFAVQNTHRGVSFTPGTSWTKFEGSFSIGSDGTLITGGDVIIDWVCTSGGMSSAVWVDDVSLEQV
ncbi:hypothetical protein ACN47E_006123 [Coniothyrium glycines]